MGVLVNPPLDPFPSSSPLPCCSIPCSSAGSGVSAAGWSVEMRLHQEKMLSLGRGPVPVPAVADGALDGPGSSVGVLAEASLLGPTTLGSHEIPLDPARRGLFLRPFSSFELLLRPPLAVERNTRGGGEEGRVKR